MSPRICPSFYLMSIGLSYVDWRQEASEPAKHKTQAGFFVNKRSCTLDPAQNNGRTSSVRKVHLRIRRPSKTPTPHDCTFGLRGGEAASSAVTANTHSVSRGLNALRTNVQHSELDSLLTLAYDTPKVSSKTDIPKYSLKNQSFKSSSSFTDVPVQGLNGFQLFRRYPIGYRNNNAHMKHLFSGKMFAIVESMLLLFGVGLYLYISFYFRCSGGGISCSIGTDNGMCVSTVVCHPARIVRLVSEYALIGDVLLSGVNPFVFIGYKLRSTAESG